MLLTTDGSNESTLAIRAASRLLAPANREMSILHVARVPSYPKSASNTPQTYPQRLAAETRRILQDAKRIAAEEGVDARTLCETGSPARVIMRASKDYDVTVIGAKGREARGEVGLGPVASRLVEHAPVSVLVGREPPRDKQARILVPVDGSSGSEQALDVLATCFDLESADITLLNVIESLWLPADNEDQADPEADQSAQFRAELRQEAERLLMDVRIRFLQQHSGVTTSIREGIPSNEILSEADQGDYDLVVVGATSATDMKHKVLGSVSSTVAWNAPCSVLLVHVGD